MILFERKKSEMFIDDRIIILAMKMQKELDENSKTKGSIFDWNPTFQEWLYEFEYHKSKLIAAIMAKDKHLQSEFTCDLANYLLIMQYGSWDIQKSITLCENEKTKII